METMLADVCRMVKEFGAAPTLVEMPHRTLQDKWIAGPTAAHVIEEIHTPLNFAYTTFTTGSSAFQNIVGITYEELPRRIQASMNVLQRVRVQPGDKVLVTYPPLVNVFSGEALKECGLSPSFLIRSSRDAFLAALYEIRPRAVVGESSFIRASLEDAKHMGVSDELPQDIILLTAGTPLDLELLPIAEEVLHAEVHDLYGCQEFGWLTLDGIPVRDDIELVPIPTDGGKTVYELVVGGLPMGDQFPVTENGHICNSVGKIITYRRQRSYPEYEVIVKATTLTSVVTLGRVARSILRIKGRIVKLASEVVTNAPHTILGLVPDPVTAQSDIPCFSVEGPVKTQLFDDLVQAQLAYQQNEKTDLVWKKRN